MRLNFNYQKQSAGFALIAAIFLVVVVGLAITYMQRLSSNQADVNVQAVQNARALEAAKSGLEWGIYRLILSPQDNCTQARFTINNIDIGFVCESVDYDEAGATVTIYTLTSTAEQGTLGDPDYVFKRMQASIEI